MKRVEVCVRQWQSRSERQLWVHVHASTPCGSGSPLRNFHSQEGVSALDQEWPEIMQAIGSYLILGNSSSFELPKVNLIWSRAETKDVLEACNLVHVADVDLCQTGLLGLDSLPVGKKLRFVANSESFVQKLIHRFGNCSCSKHADLSSVVYTQTGFYNRKLARGILDAVKAARKSNGS